MGDFRSGNRGGFGGGRGGGRGSFGGGRSGGRSFGGGRGGFGGRERSNEKYDATCSKCGKACQLPFKPRGDKPVYCSACFETEGQVSPRHSQSAGSSNSGISQEQFSKLNAKLDKIITILEDLEIISDEDEDLDEITEGEDEDSEEETKEGEEYEVIDGEEDDEDLDEDEEVVSK